MKREEPDVYLRILNELLDEQEKFEKKSKAKSLNALNTSIIIICISILFFIIFISFGKVFAGLLILGGSIIFVKVVLMDAAHYVKWESSSYRECIQRRLAIHASKILTSYEKLYKKEKGE